jgi:hypothetical protein
LIFYVSFLQNPNPENENDDLLTWFSLDYYCRGFLLDHDAMVESALNSKKMIFQFFEKKQEKKEQFLIQFLLILFSCYYCWMMMTRERQRRIWFEFEHLQHLRDFLLEHFVLLNLQLAFFFCMLVLATEETKERKEREWRKNEKGS